MATINELAPNNASTGPHQGRLATTPSQLIPPKITGLIFDQVQETSLVMKLGRSIPVQYGQTVIPVTTVRPEVGQVGTGTDNASREGGTKPLSGTAWTTKSLSPIKLATIVTVSDEFARMDPIGLYTQLQGDLAYAIGRGIDSAVFHGTSNLTGTALQGIDTTNIISGTANQVNLVNGSIYSNLLDGYDLVNNDHRFEFNGWAVDPRFRSRMLRESLITSFGVPNFPAVNLQGQNSPHLYGTTSEVLGLTAHYGRAVGGDLGANTNSGIKVIGGDFNQLAYGFADQIRVKITDQATITDGNNVPFSMWQTNQIAILIEVTFGWILGSQAGFVAFTDSGVGSYAVSVGAATAGTFTLNVGGVVTGSIAFNATVAAVKTAVVAASGLPASDVTVTNPSAGNWVVGVPSVLTAGTGTGLTAGALTVTSL